MLKYVPSELRLLWAGITSGPRYRNLIGAAFKLLAIRAALFLSYICTLIIGAPIIAIIAVRHVAEWIEDHPWTDAIGSFIGRICFVNSTTRMFREHRSVASFNFRNAKRAKAKASK